jgi:hypothetical protein
MSASSLNEQISQAFQATTLLRARDLTAQGMNRGQLRQAVQAGLLEQAGARALSPARRGHH